MSMMPKKTPSRTLLALKFKKLEISLLEKYLKVPRAQIDKEFMDKINSDSRLKVEWKHMNTSKTKKTKL